MTAGDFAIGDRVIVSADAADAVDTWKGYSGTIDVIDESMNWPLHVVFDGTGHRSEWFRPEELDPARPRPRTLSGGWA